MHTKRTVPGVTAAVAVALGIVFGATPAMADTALSDPASPAATQAPTDTTATPVQSNAPEPDPVVVVDETSPPATVLDDQTDLIPTPDPPKTDTPSAPATSDAPSTSSAPSASTPTQTSAPAQFPPGQIIGTRVPVSGSGAIAQVRDCYWGDIYTAPGNQTPDAHDPNCNVDVASSEPGEFSVKLSDIEATPEFRSLGDTSGFEWISGPVVSFTVRSDLDSSSAQLTWSPKHPEPTGWSCFADTPAPHGVPYTDMPAFPTSYRGTVQVGQTIHVSHADLLQATGWIDTSIVGGVTNPLTTAGEFVGHPDGSFEWTPTKAGTFEFQHTPGTPNCVGHAIDGRITVTPADVAVIPDPVITPPAQPVVFAAPTPEKVTVATPIGKLAQTGSDIESPLVPVLALLMLGIVAVVIGKHRATQR